jgi:hypothetical protein
MNLHAVLTIDGKAQQIEARDIQFQLAVAAPTSQGAREPMMGTQVTESFSIKGGTLTTSSTVRSADGKTTTTTTTTTTDNSTTTTNTTVTK